MPTDEENEIHDIPNFLAASLELVWCCPIDKIYSSALLKKFHLVRGTIVLEDYTRFEWAKLLWMRWRD
jgi:hypothetical protein